MLIVFGTEHNFLFDTELFITHSNQFYNITFQLHVYFANLFLFLKL